MSNERDETDCYFQAASKVNLCFKSSQFNGLVGLEASTEDLQQKTEREITLKGKTVLYQSRKVNFFVISYIYSCYFSSRD